MKWKLADKAPIDETFVIFRDDQYIYMGKRHQRQWLDKDDGIISAGVNYWLDELPEQPTFINGKPLNDDNKGWEIKNAPKENEYVLVADVDSRLNIAKFSSGWRDRKGHIIENVICFMHFPTVR